MLQAYIALYKPVCSISAVWNCCKSSITGWYIRCTFN